MARTYQTCKRSGGAIRRRPMKRRRRTSSRKTYGVNKASQRIAGATRLGGRLMRRRAYRGLLWRSSIMLPKYMYQAVSTDTLNTPGNLTSATFKVLKMLPDLDLPGSFTNNDGSDFSTIKGKVLLRGGMEKLMISTEASENVACTVYVIYVKAGSTPPASATLLRNTPIINSASDQGNEGWKVMKRFDVNLELNGGVITMYHRFKIKRYDVGAQWSNGSDCLHWVVVIANTVSPVANSVQVVRESNGSVCVDVMS